MEKKDFINKYGNADPAALRLKFLKPGLNPEERETFESAILQIEARRRYAAKFRSILKEHPGFEFPSILACEQASHEWVALYHASLASGFSSLIDLTGGLGIDFINMGLAISPDGCRCVAIEADRKKADFLANNCRHCGLNNALVVNSDSMDFLESEYKPDRHSEGKCLIYADPARRGDGDRRLYNPMDCSPDIFGHMDAIFSAADTLIIKNSPMLDIHSALSLFPGLTELHVVSVRNECKEVLVVAEASVYKRKPADFIPVIRCINFLDEDSCTEFVFSIPGVKTAVQSVSLDMSELYPLDSKSLEVLAGSDVDTFVYIPDASVMKCGDLAWEEIGRRFPSLRKLSPNCHLYLSGDVESNFPGRRMKVDGIVSRRERKSLKGDKFNVATRNYPGGAVKLAKALGVKPSPDASSFIYGVTVGLKEAPLLLRLSLPD